MSRRKRTYEATEFLAATSRFVRRAGERVATEGDAADLAELRALRGQLDDAIGAAVAGLRARGWSWGEIGTELGISRQAAQQTYGSRRDAGRVA